MLWKSENSLIQVMYFFIDVFIEDTVIKIAWSGSVLQSNLGGGSIAASTLTKKNLISGLKAWLSMCRLILYKITSRQSMQAESIIHMQTNKRNTVGLRERHVSPMTAPACCSITACGQTTCCLSSPCHPPAPHLPRISLSPPPLKAFALTPEGQDVKEQASPQPAGLRLLTGIKDLELWGFSV